MLSHKYKLQIIKNKKYAIKKTQNFCYVTKIYGFTFISEVYIDQTFININQTTKDKLYHQKLHLIIFSIITSQSESKL